MSIWDNNVDNIVISKLVKTKTKCKYLMGIKVDKAIRPLVLIMPKMNGYVEKVEVKDVDKNKNNKSMLFHIDAEKLLKSAKLFGLRLEIYNILN